MDREKKMPEANMEKVSGGTKEKEIITEMECTECGHEMRWLGNYKGRAFNCPRCRAYEGMVGVRIVGEEDPEEYYMGPEDFI